MAPTLVDALEKDVLHAVMLRGSDDAVGDLGLEPVVDDVYDTGTRSIRPVIVQHIAVCRKGLLQVVLRPVRELEAAKRSIGPGIVCAPEDQDDIGTGRGIAEGLRHAGYERTVGIILPVITGIADGRPAVAVVAQKFKSLLTDELVPPCLLRFAHVVLLLDIGIIPYCEALGNISVESGIGIPEYDDSLLLTAGKREQKYRHE